MVGRVGLGAGGDSSRGFGNDSATDFRRPQFLPVYLRGVSEMPSARLPVLKSKPRPLALRTGIPLPSRLPCGLHCKG